MNIIFPHLIMSRAQIKTTFFFIYVQSLLLFCGGGCKIWRESRERTAGTFGNSAQSMAARKIANNVKLQKCD